MEITAKEMKKSIEKIYRRLDEVTPVDFDCGNYAERYAAYMMQMIITTKIWRYISFRVKN